MIANVIEIQGTLQPDGKLILDERPPLPPGRVRVAIQAVVEPPPKSDRLPDEPWLDTSISAPFDLPRSGVLVRVQPRLLAERLPEFPDWVTEEGK